MHLSNSRRGYSIVEILVAIFVFVSIATILIYLLVDISTSNQQEKFRLTAVALAQEGLEATRNIRDSGWSNVSTGNHGLAKTNNQWEFSGASDLDSTGTFSRVVSISSLAADRLLVTSTISYNFFGLRNISISQSTYLTNWRKEVVPQPPPWIQPKTLGVVGYMDVSSKGHRNPNSIFVLGNYAYFGTAEGNEVGAEFYVFNIANPAAPTLVGSCVIGAQIQSVYVVGNYAYLATNDHNAELTILDVSNPANPRKVSGVGVPGNAVAKDIAIVGNYAYLTTNNNPSGKEFYIIDVTDPLHPVSPPISSLELGSDVNTVSVSGNYVYIGTGDDSKEIQIIDISNPASPIAVKTYDNLGIADATDILVNGTSLYLATANNGATDPDFVILSVNTSNPLQVTITKTGQMQLPGDINGLALDSVGNQIFFATSIPNKQFLIADITNPALPSEKASLSLPDVAAALAFNGTYVYVADIANGQELVIIGPG